PEALLPAVSVIAAPQGIQCTVKDDFVVLIEQHLFPGGQDQAVAQRPLTRPPGYIPGHLPQAEGGAHLDLQFQCSALEGTVYLVSPIPLRPGDGLLQHPEGVPVLRGGTDAREVAVNLLYSDGQG